jgi:hypothetical protein
MENGHDKSKGQPREAGVDPERRQAALKDGEGRTAADLDQLAQVGELASGGQPDEPAEGDPLRKKPGAPAERKSK